jgi:membrane protein DedA with SNARE-associated domain
MQHVDQFLAHYGYFALFGMLMLGIVGPLIPDETILVFAGIAVHRGQMHPLVTLGVAIAGSLCGITISYLLGRTGVVYALKRIPLLQRHVGSHLPEAHRWFDRFGKWTLFFGYFVVGVRHFTGLVAGTSGLQPETFALYAYPGGCLWVATFLGIGYYLGEGWAHMARRFDAVMLLLAILAAAAGIAWWFLKNKKGKQPPQETVSPAKPSPRG